MPNMPANTLLGYIGTVFFFFGIFLIFAGLGVIKVQQVTVTKGTKTFIAGVIIAVIGGALVLSDSRNTATESSVNISSTETTSARTIKSQSSEITLPNPTLIAASTATSGQDIVNIKLGNEMPR